MPLSPATESLRIKSATCNTANGTSHCSHFVVQSVPPLAFQTHRMSPSALTPLSLATLPFPSNPGFYSASPGYSSFWFIWVRNFGLGGVFLRFGSLCNKRVFLFAIIFLLNIISKLFHKTEVDMHVSVLKPAQREDYKTYCLCCWHFSLLLLLFKLSNARLCCAHTLRL